MRTWFSDLSPVEQAVATQEWQEAVRKDRRILPGAAGASWTSMQSHGRAQFLAQKAPFAFIRLGDCELGFLSGGIPNRRGRSLPWDMANAGFRREDFGYRADLLDAIRTSALVGVHGAWAPVEEDTAAVFHLLGLPVPLLSAVEVHSMYELFAKGELFDFLQGKKVLLVGALAEGLRTRLAERAYPAALGPPPHVTGHVLTPPREARSAVSDIPRLIGQIGAHDFDVALVSAGLSAKILCHRIRHLMNRTALDVGYIFDAILGGAERTQRPVLRDIHW
jgi:hypothetical protein